MNSLMVKLLTVSYAKVEKARDKQVVDASSFKRHFHDWLYGISPSTKALAITVIILSIALIVFILCLKSYRRNPFSKPHLSITIDISGKRQPDIDDLIDEWVIEQGKDDIFEEYHSVLSSWKEECKDYISRRLFWKKHRIEQYKQTRNKVMSEDYRFFVFEFTRRQTRYKQVNYVKSSYEIEVVDQTASVDVKGMKYIISELEKINYETTRNKYESKNQRKLMTQELRQKIILRDNYTCQKCGKYMPDEVGLHVDHIIPIKKGGKSVESNLRVLCDKCNYRKGIKTDNC